MERACGSLLTAPHRRRFAARCAVVPMDSRATRAPSLILRCDVLLGRSCFLVHHPLPEVLLPACWVRDCVRALVPTPLCSGCDPCVLPSLPQWDVVLFMRSSLLDLTVTLLEQSDSFSSSVQHRAQAVSAVLGTGEELRHGQRIDVLRWTGAVRTVAQSLPFHAASSRALAVICIAPFSALAILTLLCASSLPPPLPLFPHRPPTPLQLARSGDVTAQGQPFMSAHTPETVSTLLGVVGRVLEQSLADYVMDSVAPARGLSSRRALQESAGDALQASIDAAGDTLADLSSSMLRDTLPDEPPVSGEGGGISITVGQLSVALDDDSDAQNGGFDLGPLLSLATTVRPRLRAVANSTVLLRRLHWNVNPYAFVPNAVVVTGVVSVEVLDMDGRPLALPSDDIVPSTLALFNGAEGVTNVHCAYLDESSGSAQWSLRGVVLVGFDAVTGQAVCATLHFTDFAGLRAPGDALDHVWTAPPPRPVT
jgi:hypothetical protein